MAMLTTRWRGLVACESRAWAFQLELLTRLEWGALHDDPWVRLAYQAVKSNPQAVRLPPPVGGGRNRRRFIPAWPRLMS